MKLADEVYGQPVSGPWLACYMIRRFGWPNIGSDGHKDLCSWMLTTPIAGLYLVVTPYVGSGNHHFAVRFTKEIGAKIDTSPGRAAFFRRREQAIHRWWNATGSKLYALGMGKKEGDEDELVHLYGENKKGDVGGLWRRPLKRDRPRDKLPKGDGMLMWWLAEFIAAKHPEAEIPTKMSEDERARMESPFAARAQEAIKRVMIDLLRPSSVRDVGFGIFGRDMEKTRGPESERFEGAGNAPEYWFSPYAKGERRKASAKR